MKRAVAGVLALGVLLASAVTAVALSITRGYEPGAGPADRGTFMPRHAPTAASDEHAYLAEMVAHHEEAIEAARELRRSSRAELRNLGAAIVSSQSAQINRMERWLARWYPDRADGADYRPMMRDLSGLTGDRLDLVFLEDMIPHHMMAVMSSQRLLMQRLAVHPEVATLARSIRDEQRAEIVRMRLWLVEWFGMRGRGYASAPRLAQDSPGPSCPVRPIGATIRGRIG